MGKASPEFDRLAYADDGLPRIDILALAEKILGGGARAEIGVSQREIRALAVFALDMNWQCLEFALLIRLIGLQATDPDGKIVGLDKSLLDLGDSITKNLTEMGYLEGENDEPSSDKTT